MKQQDNTKDIDLLLEIAGRPEPAAQQQDTSQRQDGNGTGRPDGATPPPAVGGAGQHPTLQESFELQAREDEQQQSSSFTLRKILGGDFLTARVLRRQIWLILLIVMFTMVYISNRYSCDQKLIEIDKLNRELEDAKFRALSSSSELTERNRESNVLEMLKNNKDSVLKIPSQPPYIINVPEQ